MDDDDDEVFWVERPADLLQLPTPHRSDVAVYNDATKLVIVAAIVLAVLKVRAWIVVLTVGLLVIVVAYYNKHPTRARRRVVEATVEECKEVLREYNNMGEKRHVEPFVIMNNGNRMNTVEEPKLNAPREARVVSNSYSSTSNSSVYTEEFNEEEWRKTVTFVDDYVPNYTYNTTTKTPKTTTTKATKTYRANNVANVRNEHFQHLEAYYESLEDDRERLQHELEIQDTFEDRFRYH